MCQLPEEGRVEGKEGICDEIRQGQDANQWVLVTEGIRDQSSRKRGQKNATEEMRDGRPRKKGGQRVGGPEEGWHGCSITLGENLDALKALKEMLSGGGSEQE